MKLSRVGSGRVGSVQGVQSFSRVGYGRVGSRFLEILAGRVGSSDPTRPNPVSCGLTRPVKSPEHTPPLNENCCRWSLHTLGYQGRRQLLYPSFTVVCKLSRAGIRAIAASLKFFLTCTIPAVPVRFSEVLNVQTDLVHLDCNMMGELAGPLDCVRKASLGILFADDATMPLSQRKTLRK